MTRDTGVEFGAYVYVRISDIYEVRHLDENWSGLFADFVQYGPSIQNTAPITYVVRNPHMYTVIPFLMECSRQSHEE